MLYKSRNNITDVILAEYVEVERSSRSAVERGDFMKTLQEALKIGESIDTEFKSWIKVSNMRERISLAVDELIAFVN